MHFLTPAFTLLSVFVVYFVIERKTRSIYLHIHSYTAQQLQVCSARFEALSSLKLRPARDKPSYCRLLHWVKWDQMTTRQQKYVDYFLLLLTNRCSPSRVPHKTQTHITHIWKMLGKKRINYPKSRLLSYAPIRWQVRHERAPEFK